MDTTPKGTQRMRAALPDELSTVYTEETELHWRRIISACLVVLALLTTMGWILMNAVSAERAAQVISSTTGPEEPEEETASQPAVEPEPLIQQLDEAIPPTPGFNGNLNNNVDSGIEPSLNKSLDKGLYNSPDETLTRVPAAAPQTLAPNLAAKILPLYVHMPGKPITVDNPPLLDRRFIKESDEKPIPQVTLNPLYIDTLQLTSALKDKNPTDLLDAEIVLEGDKLMKVYAYSELTNLKGERVFHDWYRGTERVARVPVGVYLDDMRASTSKYIDQTMAGDWHLEITRPNGERLGRVDFRVRVES